MSIINLVTVYCDSCELVCYAGICDLAYTFDCISVACLNIDCLNTTDRCCDFCSFLETSYRDMNISN